MKKTLKMNFLSLNIKLHAFQTPPSSTCSQTPFAFWWKKHAVQIYGEFTDF